MKTMVLAAVTSLALLNCAGGDTQAPAQDVAAPAGNNEDARGKAPPTENPGKESTDTSPATPASPPAAPTCEQRWDNYVAANSVGKFAKYSSESIVTVGSNVTNTKTEFSTIVTASSTDEVTMETETESGGQPYKSSSTMTKSQFIEGCKKPAATNQSTETGSETGVKVPAGTFDTTWTITTSNKSGTEMQTKIWMTVRPSGESLFIKSVVQSNNTTATVNATTVLTETNR